MNPSWTKKVDHVASRRRYCESYDRLMAVAELANQTAPGAKERYKEGCDRMRKLKSSLVSAPVEFIGYDPDL